MAIEFMDDRPLTEKERAALQGTAAHERRRNPKDFAGLHNEGRSVFVIFDEAASITREQWDGIPVREARPDDMAIWRAILAGEERFWRLHYRSDPALYRHIILTNPEQFLRLCKTADRARYASPPCGGRPAVYRFVLFTHPFTGGRAVYSEPVD